MKNAMTAIIKKDFKAITANSRLFLTMLLVPLVMTVVLPSIFILSIYFAPEEMGELESMLKLLPSSAQGAGREQVVLYLIMNNIMPMFFLMIPVMSSSIMAASSFVGEKEKHTLETLLYCPLTLRQIFQAKVLASFLMSMAVSLFSFLAMLLVIEAEIFFITGNMVLPGAGWLVIMLLISPAISLIAVTLIVRGSAKAQSVEESQQGAVFLVLPIILLVVGQFAGILLISTWILLGIGVVCSLLAFLLLKKAMGKFSYEMLLK